VSQKPEKAIGEQKKKRQRKKRTKQTITRAVTHIRLIEANPGKLDAPDALMTVYLPLCQHYTTLFCESETGPDKYSDPVFETLLSDRLHRVAMQQAAGIAKVFAPIARTPIRRIWKMPLITPRPGPKPRRKGECPPSNGKSQFGENGSCPTCVCPSCKPMPMW
jgi:hypothetical protein